MRFNTNDIQGIEDYINANGLPDKITTCKSGIELVYLSSPCPSITLLDLSTDTGTEGEILIINIGANNSNSISGGTPPAELELQLDSLPTGMSLVYNEEREVWRIEGTPSAAGVFTPTIGGVDANLCAITPREFTITINAACPEITLGAMGFQNGAPEVGVFNQGGALISGGVAPFTLGTITGNVPDGFTPAVIENGGSWYFALFGTPTVADTFEFTVTVLDDNGCESTPKDYTIEVIP